MCLHLVAQSGLPLCNPLDWSPPGSFVHGIFRQDYWSALPFSLGDLPDPGIALMSPVSPALQADFLPTEPSGRPETHITLSVNYISTKKKDKNKVSSKQRVKKKIL